MFDIQRKKVKRFTLKVDNKGQFKVIVPLSARDSQIASFIGANQNWIAKQQRAFQKIYDSLPKINLVEKADFLYFGQFFKITFNPKTVSESEIYLPRKNIKKFLKNNLGQYLKKRLSDYQLKYGFQYSQVRVKDISSNWGSCSAKNNLNFNYHLVFCEPAIIDYLIVHELVHLWYKNHSKKYWQQVATILPDFQIRQLRLQKISQAVFCWGTKISQLDQQLKKSK